MSLQLNPTTGITLPDGSTLPRFLSAISTAGTSTAYTVTPAVSLTTYTNQMICVRFHTSASQSPTMNISALGAKALKYIDGTGTKQEVTGLQIPANWTTWIYYDGTDLVALNVNATQSSAGTQRGMFAYGGSTGPALNISTLVSNQGVVATDNTIPGTPRWDSRGCGYGKDKAIIGYGYTDVAPNYPSSNIINYVSNQGVVAADSTGVGTAREGLAAAVYGTDKGIFAYGQTAAVAPATGWIDFNMSNLVSNQGVISSDVAGVGTGRSYLGAAGYGTDKAIFGYGANGNYPSFVYLTTINRVSNQGVVATDSTGVGTPRTGFAASYGGDKAIFGYGFAWLNNNTVATHYSVTNLVSNQGVISSDVAGVGTARGSLACIPYGGDKAIFGYGYTTAVLNMLNFVNNQGVVSADITSVGTARSDHAGVGFSLTP